MKKMLSLLFLFVVLEVRGQHPEASQNTEASQSTEGCQHAEGCQKIGYADTGYIVSNLPEISQIEAELKSIGSQYEKQLNSKYEEYTTKVNNYTGKALTREEQLAAEADLNRLRLSIQKFERDAAASFRKKQEELMAPIYLRVGKSINEVTEEHKYSVIINTESVSGEKILLFFESKFDISPLVLKKLGVTVNQHRRP